MTEDLVEKKKALIEKMKLRDSIRKYSKILDIHYGAGGVSKTFDADVKTHGAAVMNIYNALLLPRTPKKPKTLFYKNDINVLIENVSDDPERILITMTVPKLAHKDEVFKLLDIQSKYQRVYLYANHLMTRKGKQRSVQQPTTKKLKLRILKLLVSGYGVCFV